MPGRIIDVLLQEMETLMNQHHYQEALQKGRTLLAMLSADEPDKRALVFYNMGTCFNELGQYAEAETQYATAVQEDPRDSDYWYNRANNQHKWGISLQRRGNSTESQTHFQQAIDYALHAKRINPGDRDILNLISLIERSM